MKLTDREQDEDTLFLDTVQQYDGSDDAMIVIQMVMNHFKFGYAGYNGYFKNRKELFDSLECFLKTPRL